ncbi:unnamed protein product, partial [Prorocentrum cordatum]
RAHQRAAAFGDLRGAGGDEAFCFLLKSKDVYCARPTPARSYEPHLLRVLDGGMRPLPVRSLAPASLLPLIDQPGEFIDGSQAVLDSMVEAGELPPARPFWGANLRRDPAFRLDLFKSLKDGALRMAIDGREPSGMRRRPVRTEPVPAAALSCLCLDAHLLRDSDSEHRGASAGLRRGFNQMQRLEVGSWFCFDCPMAIRNFDADRVRDEVSRECVHADPDTFVHPCFQGLAMSWGWSPYICNAIVEDATRGIGQVLSIPADDVSLVDAALEAILREFERRGLSFHEVSYATQDFACSACASTSSWAGRCRSGGALGGFTASPGGDSLGCPGPSTGRPITFDAEQLRELNLVKALILLAGVDLGARWHPRAHCSGASLRGYAVAASHIDADELRGIGAHRGRWRFFALDRCADDPGDPPSAEIAALAGFAASGGDDAAFAGTGRPPPGRGVARRRQTAGIEVETAAAAARRGGAARFGPRAHRRAARSAAAHGCRALSVGDNLSSTVAFEKG